MIKANEARAITNEKRKPIPKTPEFQAIMSRIERKINEAVDCGRDNIVLHTYCLPVYNNYSFPKSINTDMIDRDHFWWPYVKEELEKNGYECIAAANTIDAYIVRW